MAVSIASVLSLAGALGGWWLITHPRSAPSPASAFAPIRNLKRLTFTPGFQTTPALSPDGKFVAFASDQSGNFDIWVQAVKGGDAVRVTKSPDHDTEPDWSPTARCSLSAAMERRLACSLSDRSEVANERLTNFGVGPKWSPKGDVPSLHGGLRAAGLDCMSLASTAQRRAKFCRRNSNNYSILGVAWHPDGRVSVLG